MKLHNFKDNIIYISGKPKNLEEWLDKLISATGFTPPLQDMCPVCLYPSQYLIKIEFLQSNKVFPILCYECFKVYYRVFSEQDRQWLMGFRN